MLVGRRDTDALLVVFATQYNNFDMALPVLHCFLREHPVSVLYLKDTGPAMFLAGAPGMAADFAGLLARIRGLAADQGWHDLRVTGYSSSGYAALLAAHRLGARRFLGLSVRTDLSAGSPLPPGRLLTAAARAAIPADHLRDLRPLLAARPAPEAARPLHGTASPLDGRHAERLAGLPKVAVIAVAEASHCVSVDLVADGRWPGLLGWLAGQA